jgi:hypothetical protein
MLTGKITPIRPLVSTFNAQATAKRQLGRRWCAFRVSVSQRAYIANASHRQTSASGISILVKRKMPKLDSAISAAYRPARALPNMRRAKLSTTSTRASTATANGMRAAAASARGELVPSSIAVFMLAAMVQ